MMPLLAWLKGNALILKIVGSIAILGFAYYAATNWANSRCEARVKAVEEQAQEDRQAVTDEWLAETRRLEREIARLEGSVNEVVPENPDCDYAADLVTRVLAPARADAIAPGDPDDGLPGLPADP